MDEKPAFPVSEMVGKNAARAAPILRGQPGYRPALDRDNDGVACEPYRGR